MSRENHLYIISYDLDSFSDDNQKSKRLISFLRRYKAVSLTKSTWVLATPDSCEKLFYALSYVLEGSEDGTANEFSAFMFNFFGSSDTDRLFVSEITGPVFYEHLICEDASSQHIPLEVLLNHCPNVYDGYSGSPRVEAEEKGVEQ